MKLAEALALAPPSRARNRHDEDDLQVSVVRYFRSVLDPLHYKVFAIPNGGRRDAREGRRLKDMGVLPGVPDLAVLHKYGTIHFFELKTPTGRLRPEQEQFRSFCLSGTPYAVLRSLDDARAAALQWFKTREAA